MRLFGAPLGKFRAVRLRLPVARNPKASDLLRNARPRDLPLLEALLAPEQDHESRLGSGDLCLWMKSGESPGALLWLNVATHSDRHFGSWTRPSDRTFYLNQLFVAPRARGAGLGSRLVAGAQHIAVERGATALKTIVLHDNVASRSVFRKCGGVEESWILGVRFGGLGTIRIPRPVDRTVQDG